MASFSNGAGRAASRHNTGVEAIDLTLSSPEPEQRPRVPLHEQRLPTYFKSESSHHQEAFQVKGEGRTAKMPSSTSDTRERSINPQHLARIIDSSSSQAVKDVLKDLCKLSPALSGAVARGLARHSTFAQGLIIHHQQSSRASASRLHAVKKEREESRDARERMKQRLDARRIASGSSLNRIYAPSASSSTHGVRPAGSQSVPRSSSAYDRQPTGSQSVPKVKLDRPLDLTDSDSDEDQYIPSHFPLSTQPTAPSQLPVRDAARLTTANQTSSSPSLSERPVRAPVTNQPVIQAKTCMQCREVVEEGAEGGVCFYHEGPELKMNGKFICGGCQKSWEASTNCALGSHVIADTNLPLPTRHQANHRSRSPSKRPRIS
jgi:hypothetical protein